MNSHYAYGAWYDGLYEELFPSEKFIRETTGKTTKQLLEEKLRLVIKEEVAPGTEEAARDEVRKQAAAAEKRITDEARKEAGEQARAGAFSGVLVVAGVGLLIWLWLRR